jgi:hypothetical protein
LPLTVTVQLAKYQRTVINRSSAGGVGIVAVAAVAVVVLTAAFLD